MSRFSAIPNVPQSGVDFWQVQTLNAMKENLELLTGTGGELDGASRALTKSSITVGGAPPQTMSRVTATGSGFTISGVQVPSLDDYTKLVTDVQQLANDVATLRATVNSLITQLRG
jgi:outer membrane murein-binding lipoprotein Lpp